MDDGLIFARRCGVVGKQKISTATASPHAPTSLDMTRQHTRRIQHLQKQPGDRGEDLVEHGASGRSGRGRGRVGGLGSPDLAHTHTTPR